MHPLTRPPDGGYEDQDVSSRSVRGEETRASRNDLLRMAIRVEVEGLEHLEVLSKLLICVDFFHDHSLVFRELLDDLRVL